MSVTHQPRVWLILVALAGLVVATPVSPQTKPIVKVGYIPSDSFAALYIMADRNLPAADITADIVRLSGGSEILSQVATGQLNVGGTGMGAAGFNAVAASARGVRGPPAFGLHRGLLHRTQGVVGQRDQAHRRSEGQAGGAERSGRGGR